MVPAVIIATAIALGFAVGMRLGFVTINDTVAISK
jgi:hypothetical protein